MKLLLPVFIVVMTLLTTGMVHAQSEKAHFEFDKDVHDFGMIEEGPMVKTEFQFTNTGNSPLVISEVTASCGCTMPYWPKEPIMAGDTGTIVVEYNTKGRPGRFSKMVTITSNADEPTVRVFIKGEVIPAKEGEQPKEPSREEKPPNRPY